VGRSFGVVAWQRDAEAEVFKCPFHPPRRAASINTCLLDDFHGALLLRASVPHGGINSSLKSYSQTRTAAHQRTSMPSWTIARTVSSELLGFCFQVFPYFYRLCAVR